MSPNKDQSLIQTLNPLQRTVLIALGAASIAVGAFIAIPLPVSPVPIVLQNFFILLMALVLGPKMGTASVALYLITGALGLPVFAGGKGGVAHFYGPTGGYLVGFLLSAGITGAVSGIGAKQSSMNQQKPVEMSLPESKKRKERVKIRVQDVAAVAAGVFTVYLFGVPWLAYKLGFHWTKALLVGFLPFLPGDLIKATAAAALAPHVRRLLRKEFFPYAG
ncbi:MAG: biotin transporter BioY [Spirochaetes bacterium]|nr:biotin transporter BioY [Spirochaetota bacterium]